MRLPANLAFALARDRGASARGRRPSLDRSSWPRTSGAAALRRGRNPLSRPAVAPADAGPDVGPSQKSAAPEALQERKGDE